MMLKYDKTIFLKPNRPEHQLKIGEEGGGVEGEGKITGGRV